MTFQPPSKKIYFLLFTTFLLFSIVIGIVGYLFYQAQKENLKQEKWDQLSAIADLKVRQIENWRKELIGDGKIIMKSPFIAKHVEHWLKYPGSTDIRREILLWMASQQEYRHYQSIHLLDAEGAVRLSVPGGKEILGPDAKRWASEAMKEKKVILTDLYQGKIIKGIRLSLLVPILIPEGKDTSPLGVFLLRVDPHHFLYSLIQSWPTPSRTSETLLIRREGEGLLFLNELRHRKGTALTLQFPIGKHQLPAVMAVHEQPKIVESVDYREIPVIAAVRQIPDSPWFLVAKVDQEEIYAPIQQQAWFIAMIVTLLIVGAALSVGLLWQRQIRLYIKKLEEIVEERTRHIQELDRRQAQNEKLAATGMMAARIAHEINNPLAGIKNSFLLIKDAIPKDHCYYQYTGRIGKEIDRITAIIREMFNLYRPDQKVVSDFPIRETIRDVVTLVETGCRKHGVSVEIDMGDAPLRVTLPESPFRQILYNLLRNAIDASPRGEMVGVTAMVSGGVLVITVSDRGNGIPQEIQPLIFEPFFSTKSDPHRMNLGLGLAVSKNLAETIGGAIDFKSETGQGTVFRVTLPIRE